MSTLQLEQSKRRLRRLMEDESRKLNSIPHPLKPGFTMLDYADALLEMEGPEEFKVAMRFLKETLAGDTPKRKGKRK